MKNEIIHKTIARILAPAPVPKKVFPIQLIKKKKIRKYTAVKNQTSICSTSKTISAYIKYLLGGGITFLINSLRVTL